MRLVLNRVRLFFVGGPISLSGGSEAGGPAERHEFYRIIAEQANHMRGLIGDLLDAGRIEAGTLSVAPELSEVAALVDRARSTFLSAGGRHTVLIDLPPDLPRVMADRPRIVQVLNNLLSNAARHSPHSAPIRVAAERDGAHVAVSVETRAAAWHPSGCRTCSASTRTPTAAAARPPALSLGLIICKGLVEAHGGRIRAESGGIGQGTRFIFTVPVAEDARPRESAGPGPRPAAAPQEPHEPPGSWWSTTTRRRCATCATRSPRRATPWW